MLYGYFFKSHKHRETIPTDHKRTKQNKTKAKTAATYLSLRSFFCLFRPVGLNNDALVGSDAVAEGAWEDNAPARPTSKLHTGTTMN